jgi:hypothetical protein
MNLDFIGQNVHFALNLLAALSMFAVFWLTFDAWLERKKRLEAIKWFGFLSLALGFLLNAASVEQISASHTRMMTALPLIAVVLRVLGYVLVIAAQLADPLIPRPKYKNELDSAFNKKLTPAVIGGSGLKVFLLPLLPLAIAGLYWRRATTGLERHLKPVAYGFVGLTFYELLSAITGFQDTMNPLVYNVVRSYGLVWWLAQIALITSAIIFGNWVWRYLTKRLLSRIFIVLVTTTVGIYFISTAGFSFLLLTNTKDQAVSDILTASQVLNYAFSSNKQALEAQAEAASVLPGLAAAATTGDHQPTLAAIGTFARDHHVNSLTVTNADAKVLVRSEDPTRYGDSLSNNSLIQRAMVGHSVGSVLVTSGVVAPTVSLIAVQPVRDHQGFIVGSVSLTQTISNAFVDNIKSGTGLDSTVYGNDQRSATTLKTADTLHREIGIKEINPTVLKTVLHDGKSYSGEASFQNRSYLAAYSALKDADGTTVGMLLVARPASQLLASASRSTELTFLTAVGLLFVSIFPVYVLARKITGDVR